MIFLKGFWLSHVFAIFKIPLPFIFFIPIRIVMRLSKIYEPYWNYCYKSKSYYSKNKG
jgi:hypothetical protein